MLMNDNTDKLKAFAFGVANCAIHDFRIGKIEKGTWLYDEISAKIDWYNQATSNEA